MKKSGPNHEKRGINPSYTPVWLNQRHIQLGITINETDPTSITVNRRIGLHLTKRAIGNASVGLARRTGARNGKNRTSIKIGDH